MSDAEAPKHGPTAITGSEDAKRKMALMLEAIAGMRTIQSACNEMEIAVAQYYALETRMLQAMVDALEPQKRGRKVDVVAELERQRDAYLELERELLRLQALYRTTQRAVGVKEAKASKKASGKKTTRSRRTPKKPRVAKLSAKLDEASRANMAAASEKPDSGRDHGNGAPQQGS